MRAGHLCSLYLLHRRWHLQAKTNAILWSISNTNSSEDAFMAAWHKDRCSPPCSPEMALAGGRGKGSQPAVLPFAFLTQHKAGSKGS